MKLAAAFLAVLLAIPGAASADDMLRPPSGPVVAEEGAPARPPRHAMKQARLKRALLARFDRDQDGRLGPRERQQAIRALRRLERQLARGQGPRRRAIQRYDRNGDGNVGPREMPPGAARRMRPLDRDRDGWVSPGEE